MSASVPDIFREGKRSRMRKIGILGMGQWAKNIVGNVQGRTDKACISAAWSRSLTKVSDFCAQNDITLRENIEDVLSDEGVDGVIVSGPAQLHSEVAKMALKAGKHTMVIKPIALNHADAAEMKDLASARGIVLALGFDRCFLPTADLLRKRVADGELGKIIHAEGNFCVPRFFDLTEGDWKAGNQFNPPGSLADHMLYTMIELIGPVAALSVKSRTNAAPVNIADTVSVGLEFSSGATGTLTAIGVTQAFERLHIFGTKGWAEIRGRTRFEFNPVDGEAVVEKLATGSLLLRQVEAFADAIEGGMSFPVSLDLAVNSAACFEAMHLANKSGTWERVKNG
ncbi:MAG: Gfo/Idh/MocA family oxidoreductase [Rhodospirillaceae bacterium]